MSSAILEVIGLVKRYRLPRASPFGPAGTVAAVDHVDFAIEKGRSLGIVGESGSGKSTLARAVMALERPTAGTIRMLGRDFAALTPGELRKLRRGFQMVFQDPYGSLDPRSKVASIVAEPLEALDDAADGAERRRRVQASLESVGLRASALDKYPHEFSGGQRQRIAIARALVTEPQLVVADEPVSALDVSVQAQVLNLLLDLRDRYGLSYLLISHDLAIVEYVCDAAAVMYRGRIVERAETRALFLRPAHPYTRLLLEAVPRPLVSRKRHSSTAEADQDAAQSGCAFRARCPFALPRCAEEAPPLREFASGHWSACHFAETVADAPRA
jgi:peptide/nickel transport system ATP-binding protein